MRKVDLLNQHGVTMLEYMFLALLILVVCLASVKYLGDEILEIFENPTLQEGMET